MQGIQKGGCGSHPVIYYGSVEEVARRLGLTFPSVIHSHVEQRSRGASEIAIHSLFFDSWYCTSGCGQKDLSSLEIAQYVVPLGTTRVQNTRARLGGTAGPGEQLVLRHRYTSTIDLIATTYGGYKIYGITTDTSRLQITFHVRVNGNSAT